ncbi:MAG: TauD/TfdA family dioxygenase, partial [Pseudomonadota bacterium]|nr:TauD/TfdA family dioxygenase [Pseudomonadota bacterium]
MTLEVKPLSNVMGARIIGLDLNQPLSDSAKSTLKSAFLDYHLLCFETPPLSAGNFLEFSKEFGTPQLQLLENLRDNDFPEVSILNSTYKTPEAKPKNLTEVRLSGWHTDDS